MQFFPLAAVLLLFSSAAVASQKAQPSPECISHSQVAVLGAGAAGISAAATLAAAGTSNLAIFEATSAIGGRVREEFFAGHVIELGANWVQPAKASNPVWHIAQSIALHGNLTDELRTRVATQGGLVSPLVEAEPPPHAAVQALARVLLHLQKTCSLAKRLRDSQKPDIDMQQALQQVGWSPRSSIEAATMAVQVELFDALPASNLSLFTFWGGEGSLSCDGAAADTANYFVSDSRGYSEVIRHMAAGIPDAAFAFNTTIERIDATQQPAVLHLAGGGCATADRIIVTFSVGVLQAAPDLFLPPLPPPQQQALSLLRMGVFVKLFLVFPHAFWDTNADIIIYDGRLLAIASASRAHEAQALPLPELQRRAMAALTAIYGDSAVPPTSATCNRWLADPLFRGTYSNALPGFSEAHARALEQPHAGAVFLSGEALAWPENGYVQSAIAAGQQAAARVLLSMKPS